MKSASEFVRRWSEKKVPPLFWAGIFLGVVFLRTFLESFLAGYEAFSLEEILGEFFQNLFFFLIAFILLWLLLAFVLKTDIFRFSGLFLWASFLILLPPALDMLKTGGAVYWSFYVLDGFRGLAGEFFSVFGRLPSGIVYFGTKIVFLAAVFLTGALVFSWSKSFFKAVFSAIAAYGIFFFLGSLPSWITFFYLTVFEKKALFEIKAYHIAQFFGAAGKIFGLDFSGIRYGFASRLNLVYFLILVFLLALCFFLYDRKKILVMAKNARFPQLFFHGGLLFCGLGLGFLAYPQNFQGGFFPLVSVLVLLSAVFLAWEASVIFNDVFDEKIDRITNAWRPLPSGVFEKKEYLEIGVILFLLSLLGGLILGTKFFALLLSYQIIAWFYSAPPFRLKKFPLIASAVSAAALIMVLFAGFALFSGEKNIEGLSFRIIFLLLAGYTLSLPVKDFRDALGDKKYGVRTIPVVFGEKWGRISVGAGIFASFMLSVFLLNEKSLFWWALLFGSSAFGLMNWKKISARALSGWIMAPVFVYGLILVKIVFL